MPEETLRTLASARQTLMPPEYGVEAKRGLQGTDEPEGRTWNFSLLQAANVGCHKSGVERPQRLPPAPQRAYFSVTRMVRDVPS